MEGKLIQDYILDQFNQSVKEFSESFDSDGRAGYLFLNKVVKRERLTPNDKKRLLKDFNLDANQIFSENVINSNYASNNSSIVINDPKSSYEILKLKYEALLEKTRVLEEVNQLLRDKIDMMESKKK